MQDLRLMFQPGPYGWRGFSYVEGKDVQGVVGTRSTDWVLKGEEGGMTTPLLQYVARFDGEGEIFGFGGGGYKKSWPWRSLLVGFPSLLFAAPSGEKLALPMCWNGTSMSTISRVFAPIFFFGQSVVVDVEGMGFRPRAVVAGRGVVAVCTRISSQENVYDKYVRESRIFFCRNLKVEADSCKAEKSGTSR